jgi:peptide/nickel transport system substrate-binding protein
VIEVESKGAEVRKLAVSGKSASGKPPFAHKMAPDGPVAHDSDRPGFWPLSQLLARQFRILARTAALGLLLSVAVGCRAQPEPAPNPSAGSARPDRLPARGGAAVASIRTEPRSFNRLAARDSSTDLVSSLTQAKLVRINKVTQEVEPWLAQSWKVDDAGRRYEIVLRPNVRFSDGQPFTADDVVFTFRAVYDAKVQSPLADALTIGGKPIDVTSPDAHTVVLTLPSRFAPGLRLLNNLPILPKHVLEPALKDGTFASAWGLSTPPGRLVGMGPFLLTEYVPGQRLTFDRNPQYWRTDEKGTALPYLDRLTVEIVPDQNAELLRLQTGQLDLTSSEIPPEAYAATRRAADQGLLKLHDLGVALVADSLWFNLKPGAFKGDSREAWLQRDELRRAISMAVDRRLFAETVFFGAGEPVDGPETPSNKKWYSPEVPRVVFDPEGAKQLLASIGLTDRNNDGKLEDAAGRPVTFTLVTQKGRPKFERGAAVVREALSKIGVTMDVAAIEGGAVVERIVTGKYEAVYFSPQATDTDPGTNPDFWLSTGTAHLWNMAQRTPATEWEKRIDELMARQVAASDEADRRRLFTDVLRIFAEHQPVIYFAAPRVVVAASARMFVTPALDPLPSLWSPDTLGVTAAAGLPRAPR